MGAPTVYFAGANQWQRLQILLEQNVDTILVAWRHVKDGRCFEKMAPLLAGKRVILDPGYGHGGDPAEYAAFAKEYAELFEWCLAWDVPGAGEFVNTHWLFWSVSVGIPKLVGVFHPGMPWRFIGGMQALCGRVAFGGLLLMPVQQRITYLDEAFWTPDGSLRTPGLKAHGCGMDNPVVLARYPWDSTDATTWMNPLRFGKGGTLPEAVGRQAAKGRRVWAPVGRPRFQVDPFNEFGWGINRDHALEQRVNEGAGRVREDAEKMGMWWCEQCQCAVPEMEVSSGAHGSRAGGCGSDVQWVNHEWLGHDGRPMTLAEAERHLAVAKAGVSSQVATWEQVVADVKAAEGKPEPLPFEE